MNNELLNEIKILTSDIKELKKVFREKIEEKESRLQELIEKVSKIEEEKEARFQSFDSYVTGIQTDTKDRLKEMELATKQAGELSQAIDAQQKKFNTMKETFEKIEGNLQSHSQVAAKIDAFLTEQKKHEDAMEQIAQRCDENKKNNTDLTNRNNELDKKITNLLKMQEYADSNCDKIGNKIDALKEDQRVLEEKQREFENTRDDFSKMQKEFELLNKDLNACIEAAKALQSFESKQRQHKDDLQKLAMNIGSLDQAISSDQKKHSDLIEKWNKLSVDISRLASYAERLNDSYILRLVQERLSDAYILRLVQGKLSDSYILNLVQKNLYSQGVMGKKELVF